MKSYLDVPAGQTLHLHVEGRPHWLDFALAGYLEVVGAILGKVVSVHLALYFYDKVMDTYLGKSGFREGNSGLDSLSNVSKSIYG